MRILILIVAPDDALPDDINALKEALIIERVKALEVMRSWRSRGPRRPKTWR
jgi:hypothetical protein